MSAAHLVTESNEIYTFMEIVCMYVYCMFVCHPIVRITCETLDGMKCASLEVDVDQYYNMITFPGTLMIVLKRKATFWDPITHSPLSLQRKAGTVDREEQDLSFQSDMVHCRVLRVWDISHPGERVFGCMAALAFNDTLVVVERKVR